MTAKLTFCYKVNKKEVLFLRKTSGYARKVNVKKEAFLPCE